MTEPQQLEIPKSPTIEKLRTALAYYREEYGCAVPIQDLCDAAAAVVAEHDAQIAAVELMMSMPRPTAEQIRAQFLLTELLDQQTHAQPSMSDVDPTLRHNDGTPIYVDTRVEGAASGSIEQDQGGSGDDVNWSHGIWPNSTELCRSCGMHPPGRHHSDCTAP